MSNSRMFIIFFFLYFFTTFVSPASLTRIKKCPEKQSEALLLFKHNLSSINYPNHDCNYTGSDYHPKMMSWNTSTDCCNWDGVTCDNSTGDVISLDLYCGMLQGTLHPHSSLFNLLTHLTSLDLGSNKLNGALPSWLFTSPSLEEIYLNNNMLSGNVPFESFTSPSLKVLALSENQLGGQIDVQTFPQLTNLTDLDLSYNNFSGELPSWLFTSPSLQYLRLNDNMFSGNVPFESFTSPSLKYLYLSNNNQLGGQIDVQTFPQLTNLTTLRLSYNNFSGELELDTLLSTLTNLEDLNLSYSGFSVTTNNANHYVNPGFRYLRLASCKLKVFPNSFRAMKQLQILDLSSNEIHGQIPHWAGEIGDYGLKYLNLQSNLIEGPFPPSICNMSNLMYLDMSNNHFGGLIPQCFGNIISSFLMIDMGNNNFQGTIPSLYDHCENLEGLILKGNQLEGELPSSLSKCRWLKVLDLGNNHLNGTFPGWLGDLPNLQALVLKSNNLHGHIQPSATVDSPFPSLRVLDLSHNMFVGQLPAKYFQNFNSMKNVVKSSTRPEYLSMGGEYYSFVVAVKGMMLDFRQIFVGYTIINMSNNSFEGQIPNVISGLNSLIVLNLSHNSLTGPIPHALGNLIEIESLDLSWNQLTGEIPGSFAGIKHLAALSFSHNHLVGRIPYGTQLNTFNETSFEGNVGLCGFPLPKKCSENAHKPQLEAEEHHEEENGFTWKVVTLGYGCGTLVGLVMGSYMLSTRKVKWFNAIADAAESLVLKKRKRRHIYIGK